MISQGVLPSQMRTRLSCLDALSSNAFGGGAKGQPAARVIGKSGTSGAVSPVLPVSRFVIARSLEWT